MMFAFHMLLRGGSTAALILNTIEEVQQFYASAEDARKNCTRFTWSTGIPGGPECWVQGSEIVAIIYNYHRDYSAEQLELTKKIQKRYDAGEGWKQDNDDSDAS